VSFLGYVEGAFTGARRGGRPGKFELAQGGTLFLDEIGDMPLEQQVTLLRVLQEKQINRIGDTQYIDIDVRIVCATNKNLLDEVRRGTFRLGSILSVKCYLDKHSAASGTAGRHTGIIPLLPAAVFEKSD